MIQTTHTTQVDTPTSSRRHLEKEPWLSRLPDGSQAPSTHIRGNAPTRVKQVVANLHHELMSEGSGFGEAVGRNLKICSTDVKAASSMPDELADVGLASRKLRSTVVCEIVVDKYMVNKLGNLHGACSGYLVELCTSFPMVALNAAQGSVNDFGVSQNIDTMFHATTERGSLLRIMSTSLSVGRQALTAKVEAWDVTHDRLVFSGTHMKLLPTRAKL